MDSNLLFNFNNGFCGESLPAKQERCALIAISANVVDGTVSSLHGAYSEAIIAAGGVPLVIPFNCDTATIRSLISMVDGLLLSGGGDIEASYFGQENMPGGVTDLNPMRDYHELTLIRAAWDAGVPIMGICRGMQLLNVAFGGDIYQDMPSQVKGELLRHSINEPREVGVHQVEVEQGTLLHEILALDSVSVNSRHHQGVCRVAPNFIASAIAKDGIVEAIESREDKIIAVQWHPENMATAGGCEAMQRLFRYFVTEASLRSLSRAIHARDPIVDSHCDTPMLYGGVGFDFARRNTEAKLDRVKMHEGGLDSAVVVAYIPQSTPKQRAAEMTLEILDRFTADIERCEGVVQVRTPRELIEQKRVGVKSVMLGLENGHGLGGELSMIDKLKQRGVVYLTLCHNGTNEICDSARGEELYGGVSPFGCEVIAKLNQLGVIVDVSHSSESSTFAAIALSIKPIMASHSACKALCDHPRNLSDEAIIAIAASGGVVQVCGYGGFLVEESVGREANIYDLIEHIEHIISLVGYDYVGIGSDFDGDGGVQGFDGANHFMNITVELLRRGHSADNIAKIMGGNFLRVIEANL